MQIWPGCTLGNNGRARAPKRFVNSVGIQTLVMKLRFVQSLPGRNFTRVDFFASPEEVWRTILRFLEKGFGTVEQRYKFTEANQTTHACRPRGGAVWDKSIDFVDGYKLRESFRVPARDRYYLAIRYNKESRLIQIGENPVDRFSVAFSIRDGLTVIKEATLVDPNEMVIFGKNYTIRVLCSFEGRPRRRYDLFLQIRKPEAELGSTRPRVLILTGP